MITQERKVDTPPTSSNQQRSTLSSLWHEALLPYLCTRLVLVLVGLLADFYLLPLLKSNPILPPISLNTHFPDTLWLMWKHFDAGFYVDIAEHGYWAASTLGTTSNWIFLPLFPMLMNPLGHLFGGSDSAFNIAGVIISNIAGLVVVTALGLFSNGGGGSDVIPYSQFQKYLDTNKVKQVTVSGNVVHGTLAEAGPDGRAGRGADRRDPRRPRSLNLRRWTRSTPTY